MDQQSRSLVAVSHIASGNVTRPASEGAGPHIRLCRSAMVSMCCDAGLTQLSGVCSALSRRR